MYENKSFCFYDTPEKQKKGQTNIDSRGNFELITDYLRSNPYYITVNKKYINLTIYINTSK